MKDIRGPLRVFLLADPTVSGMVNGSRIYPQRLPQDVVDPSVIFNRISEIGDYHMQGDSGLGQVRMQIDSVGTKADLAALLSNAVYDRLTGQSGPWIDGAVTVYVRGVFLAAGRDDFDEVTRLFKNSRDYIIWYGAST